MLNLKTIALATALTLSAGAGAAIADSSALGALSSATHVSVVTVSGAEASAVMPGGIRGELVDLDSVKARVQNSPMLLAQLESYGASIDDIVGITGTSEKDVTLYVRG